MLLSLERKFYYQSQLLLIKPSLSLLFSVGKLSFHNDVVSFFKCIFFYFLLSFLSIGTCGLFTIEYIKKSRKIKIFCLKNVLQKKIESILHIQLYIHMHFMFYLVNICLLALHHNLKEQEASKAVCFSRKNKKKYIGAMQRAISTDVTSYFFNIIARNKPEGLQSLQSSAVR